MKLINFISREGDTLYINTKKLICIRGDKNITFLRSGDFITSTYELIDSLKYRLETERDLSTEEIEKLRNTANVT